MITINFYSKILAHSWILVIFFGGLLTACTDVNLFKTDSKGYLTLSENSINKLYDKNLSFSAIDALDGTDALRIDISNEFLITTSVQYPSVSHEGRISEFGTSKQDCLGFETKAGRNTSQYLLCKAAKNSSHNARGYLSGTSYTFKVNKGDLFYYQPSVGGIMGGGIPAYYRLKLIN